MDNKIIEMAKPAAWLGGVEGWTFNSYEELETFAKLVEQNKIKEIADKCEKLPFGDTAQSFAAWIREQ